VFLCVCRRCPRGSHSKNHQKHTNKNNQNHQNNQTLIILMEIKGNGDGDHRKWRRRFRRRRQRHRRARVPRGQWVPCGEPCRVGSNGNQRKMVRGQNHQKSLKTTKTTKINKNHQNLVEMKGNGKGYLRGTVVDLMETTGKW
jgi:hypothetical protein